MLQPILYIHLCFLIFEILDFPTQPTFGHFLIDPHCGVAHLFAGVPENRINNILHFQS